MRSIAKAVMKVCKHVQMTARKHGLKIRMTVFIVQLFVCASLAIHFETRSYVLS